jgi:putative membrane protein
MLGTVAHILVGVAAAEHLFFLVLEAFLWQTPYGLKTFKMDAAQAAATASLAKNQGTYNGFLAAGLIWSLMAPATRAGSLQIFFLSCIVVAAVVGAMTANIRILFVQGLIPAVALALVLMS